MAINNESDWLSSDWPEDLANYCTGNVNTQRFRWLAIAWGNRILEYLRPWHRDWYEAYKTWVSGAGRHPSEIIQARVFEPLENLAEEIHFAREFVWQLRNENNPMVAARCAWNSAGWFQIATPKHYEGYSIDFCNQFRDVAGNPFRPVTLNPRWQTDNVTRLAQTIDDTGHYHLMPILADALLEADCDSADVLKHCREETVHVRGCWVIDLLLGRM